MNIINDSAPQPPPAARGGGDGDVGLLTLPLAQLITRAPVTLSSDSSIQAAAALMAERRISSLPVVVNGRLCGIVTDRDLRSRVIAAGLAYDRPLAEIMTPEPLTVELGAYGFEALLLMARHRVHHLPVLDGARLAGMVTSTDLLKQRSGSPAYLLGDVYNRESVAELAAVSARLPRLLLNLVEASASAQNVGRVISSVGEAISGRLLQLAERELGPPPLPYAWLSGGSLARFEQTALSDQDNCLLLADGFDAGRHGAYFERLARFVCDGLNACGYVYCPGEVMAVTPQWRQPLATWKRYFDGWIDRPEPRALMLSCVFFDLRLLYGDPALFNELRRYVLAKSPSNKIYLAFMAANALSHRPPLGVLRQFTYPGGSDKPPRRLDLKHNGVIPIVDLARIYSLAGGIAAVNTQERLRAAAAGLLSRDGADDLCDALEFIASVRLQHQARQIKRGEAPDNFVAPRELSRLERRHLKDAFAVVKTLQAALAQRYQTGWLG